MNLNPNILIMGCSLFYIVSLFINFLVEKRTLNKENKIFFVLIVCSLIGVILDICQVIGFNYIGLDSLFTSLVTKGFLLYLVSWAIFFAIYTIYVSTSLLEIKEKGLKIYNYLKNIICAIYFIAIALIIALPLYLYNENGIQYSYGPSASVVYVISILCIIVCVVSIIVNFKRLNKAKYTPIIFFVTIGAVIMAFQQANPQFLLYSSMEVFILYLMYFTIENPDFKMIRELNYQKEQAEKSRNISNKVIDTFTSNLEPTINEFNRFGHKKINYNDIDEVKKEVKDMQKFSLNFVDQIDSLVALAKIQSEGFKLNKKNYEPKQLVLDILDLFKLKDKNILVNTNEIHKVPSVLYGDATLIKQLFMSLYDGILRVSDVKSLDFNLSSMSVGSLYRVTILVEIDKKNIKKEYTDFFKKDTLILEFEVVKRLVNLMNSKFDISVKNNKLCFEIILDQHSINDYEDDKLDEEEDKSKINYFDASSKRILIIDDDKERIKKLRDILAGYKVFVDSIESAKDMDNKFTSSKKFDMVIVDDIIPDIDAVRSYLMVNTSNKLARVMDHVNYDLIKIMMVTPNKMNYEDKYKEEGFEDTITKPLTNKKIDSIMKKYMK